METMTTTVETNVVTKVQALLNAIHHLQPSKEVTVALIKDVLTSEEFTNNFEAFKEVMDSIIANEDEANRQDTMTQEQLHEAEVQEAQEQATLSQE